MIKRRQLLTENNRWAKKYFQLLEHALVSEMKETESMDKAFNYCDKGKYREAINVYECQIRKEFKFSAYIDIAFAYQWMNCYEEGKYYANKALKVHVRYTCYKIFINMKLFESKIQLDKKCILKIINEIKIIFLCSDYYSFVLGALATSNSCLGSDKKAKELRREMDLIEKNKHWDELSEDEIEKAIRHHKEFWEVK